MTSYMFRSNHALIVRLFGELDGQAQERLASAFVALINTHNAIIDLTDVAYADTTLVSAVARILRLRKVHFGKEAPLRIVGARPIIMRMFRVTHIDPLVEFYDSLHDAEREGRFAISGYIYAEEPLVASPAVRATSTLSAAKRSRNRTPAQPPRRSMVRLRRWNFATLDHSEPLVPSISQAGTPR